jgi:hypothetical protein
MFHEQFTVVYTSGSGTAVWIFMKFDTGETLWINFHFNFELFSFNNLS